MKGIGRHTSRRWGYDGWALRVRGAEQPLTWTWSTTRRECREVLKEARDEDLFVSCQVEIVKVRQKLEVVSYE